MGDIERQPLYSYVHLWDKSCLGSFLQGEYSFPHFYYCNGCDRNYYLLSTLQPYNNVMGRDFRDARQNLVPLSTELVGFDYYGNFTCNKRKFNRIKKSRYCSVGDYVVGILKDKLNFTNIPDNSYNKERPIVPHDFISEQFFDDFRLGQAQWNFPLIESEMTVDYCDFSPPRTSKASFRAWWAPYQMGVWAILLIEFFALSIVLAYFRMCVESRSDLMSKKIRVLTFLRSWSDMWLEIIRFLLRQDDTLSLFLLTCSYLMLIFTCLYENIITAQLIVPDEVQQYRTIDELTDDGYTIIILVHSNLLLERRLPNSVNETFAEHFLKIGKSKTDFYEGVKFEYQEANSNTALKDVGNASSKYAVLQVADIIMHRYTINLLRKLHGVLCYKVTNSLANGLKFMYFRNFLVYKQLRLAQLMRDHGLLSWFYELQEHSQKLVVAHLQGNKDEVSERVSSYISNMNLVPVYSVWFAFNLIGVVVFCVERNCNCERYFARNWILLPWSQIRNNSFVRGCILLLRTFMKSVRKFHNYVLAFGLFKKAPIVQLQQGMKSFVGRYRN
jgi:hypothetical protein